MKPIKIAITYRDKVYFLDRVEKETDHYQIGFESGRWSIHIYLLQNGQIRVIINKSVKKSDMHYSTQFHYDCYCTLETNGLYLNDVHDPATCKRIRNQTKWFVIEPMLKAIYSQLKDELKALHPFDLIHDCKDLVQFIYHKMEAYGETGYLINNSLRFGIGENAYTTTEEAIKAKEKESVIILNLHNGYHVISKDTVVFFLYWLLDRDKYLNISDGQRTKTICTNPE